MTADTAVTVPRQARLTVRRFLRHRPAMVSLGFLIVLAVAAFNADLVAPYAYDEINVSMRGTRPTLEDWHLFGTDQVGRDYFSRVLYGTRTSFQVAGIVAGLSTLIGVVVGALAGYYRGWVDAVLMRLTDLVLILPALAVLLVASTYLGSGRPLRIAVILAALLWVTLARVVRGVFLSLREQAFVEAARAAGASDVRIVIRHMLPSAAGPIVVNLTLVLAAAIIIESTLAFLGLGVQPPVPALGRLINDGRNYMQTQWWLMLMPLMTLVAICLAVNFVGDGLRDALDPSARRRR